MKRLLLTLLTSLALLPAALVTATPAHAGPSASPAGAAAAGSRLAGCPYTDVWVWYPTFVFNPGDCYQGPKGTLYMQDDGNFVLYHEDGWPMWHTGTYADNVKIWHTGTAH